MVRLLNFTISLLVISIISSCAIHKYRKALENDGKDLVYIDTELDTNLFFGIWTTDPEGPHADFWISDQSFYVVDYDGNGAMPYVLKKNKITVKYPDYKYSGKIEHVLKDLLIIRWEHTNAATIYVPFPTETKSKQKKQEMHLKLNKMQVLQEVPSASGVAIYNDQIIVAGDNSPYLYFLDMQFSLLKNPLIFNDNDMVNDEIPKPIKPDFESVELIDDNTLLILGSGSRLPQRALAVLFELKSEQYKSYDISAIYNSLLGLDVMKGFELNLEALASTKSHLYLFNRANNVIFCYPKSELIAAIKNGKIPSNPISYNFELPKINGIESGFSGATVSKDETKLIFTSSVEDTDNAYDDGEILGSFVGCIDISSQLENSAYSAIEVFYPPRKLKIESVSILSESNSDYELLLVTDNDGAASEIIKATLSLK